MCDFLCVYVSNIAADGSFIFTIFSWIWKCLQIIHVNGYLCNWVRNEFSKQCLVKWLFFNRVCPWWRGVSDTSDRFLQETSSTHVILMCSFTSFIASTASCLTWQWNHYNRIRSWCSLMMMNWGFLWHYCSQMDAGYVFHPNDESYVEWKPFSHFYANSISISLWTRIN